MFVQECPVCGRPAQILLQHRGESVTCRHCCGGFVAGAEPTHTAQLLQRAEKLLETAVRRLHVRSTHAVNVISDPAANRKLSA